MSLPPGSRLGPYEVLSLLGAGGMGEVYCARDSRLGRDVAVKVLPAELMVTPEGAVKVLDFGLAKLLAPEAASGEDETTMSDADRPSTLLRKLRRFDRDREDP